MKRINKRNSFNTFFVNKYGIASSCEIHPKILESDITKINEDDYINISNYDRVYVISSALKDWFKKIYPKLKKKRTRIILVTGDSIKNTPLEALSVNQITFNKIIDEKIIIHWFCQNCDYENHKDITPIPIGIDYHTINRKAYWGQLKTHYLLQDLNLYLLSNRSFRDIERRRYNLFCDIHLNKGVYNRRRMEAFNCNFRIARSFVLSNQQPRNKYWKTCKKSKFILSPRGNGNDTHRSWEALCLGVIPIVETSCLDSLFDNLPALIVESFSEVNEQLLSGYSFPKQIKYEKLRLDYWIELIKNTQYRVKFNTKSTKLQLETDSNRIKRNMLSIFIQTLKCNPILILVIPYQFIRNYIFYLSRHLIKKTIIKILGNKELKRN